MASDSFVQPAVPHFDGHYDHWNMLMENFLRSKEYWQVVSTGILEPATSVTLTETQRAELEGLKLKDLKAKNYLFQAIDRSILEAILCKETSKDIWDSMKKKYQGSSRTKRVQLQALRRSFETLQMKDDELVTSYCARTMAIASKMRFHGEKMEDVAIVEMILRSLAPKYNYVACSIEESKDIDNLSLDEIQREGVEVEGLEAEVEVAEMEEDEEISKLIASNQSVKIQLPQNKTERTNFAESNEVETLLMAFHTQEDHGPDIWYVDTGCSNHMCANKSIFSDLNEDFHSTISFGDHSTVKVMGKGDIKIRTKNGFEEKISNVFYVPDLKCNLLSAGQLKEKGCVITIRQGA
ncbi:uncharacterized protein [Henckelia pumila]|uniref:uncharacterized protein n=1 Tax=Henckelia pumila TaxID=405737 RepID=UPI003C6E219A